MAPPCPTVDMPNVPAIWRQPDVIKSLDRRIIGNKILDLNDLVHKRNIEGSGKGSARLKERIDDLANQKDFFKQGLAQAHHLVPKDMWPSNLPRQDPGQDRADFLDGLLELQKSRQAEKETVEHAHANCAWAKEQSDKKIEGLERELRRLKEEGKKKDARLDELGRRAEGAQQPAESLPEAQDGQSQIVDLKKQLHRLEEEGKKKDGRLDELGRRAEGAQQPAESLPKGQDGQSQIADLQKKIAMTERERDKLKTQLNDQEKQVKQTKHENAELNRKIKLEIEQKETNKVQIAELTDEAASYEARIDELTKAETSYKDADQRIRKESSRFRSGFVNLFNHYPSPRSPMVGIIRTLSHHILALAIRDYMVHSKPSEQFERMLRDTVRHIAHIHHIAIDESTASKSCAIDLAKGLAESESFNLDEQQKTTFWPPEWLSDPVTPVPEGTEVKKDNWHKQWKDAAEKVDKLVKEENKKVKEGLQYEEDKCEGAFGWLVQQ